MNGSGSLQYWNSGERLFRIFEDRVYGDDFCPLSGWDEIKAPIEFPSFRVDVGPDDLSRYFYDFELENRTFDRAKELVSELLSAREGRTLNTSEVLLAPGTTAAAAAAVIYAYRSGIRCMIADPPVYFSYLRLAELLGMKLVLVPRTIADCDDPKPLSSTLRRLRHEPKLLILTDPRYVLSSPLSLEMLSHASRELSDFDTVIFDRAVDLSETPPHQFDSIATVVTLRSIGKSVTANASRLSAIIAAPKTIRGINRVAGWLYGSLDAAMISLGVQVMLHNSFNESLKAVQSEVISQWRIAIALLTSSRATVPRPVNGYLGHAILDLTGIGRYQLFQHLLRNNVHAMFGIHVGFQPIENRELVRINYLVDFREALRRLNQFFVSQNRELRR